MKKTLRFVVPVLLVLLAVLVWRWTHPILSDEEQIRQSLDGIAAQASHKNAGGITSFLTQDFQLDGLRRKEIRQQLTVGMLQYAVITMKVLNSQVKVNGDTATSTGTYQLGLKNDYNSPEQTTSGDFSLKWKKEDGAWKVSNADGNKLPPGLGAGP